MSRLIVRAAEKEKIGGTLVTEGPEGLSLRSDLKSTALGALSWYLLFQIPLFLVRAILHARHSPLAGNAFLLWGGPVAGFVALVVLLTRPPLIVRRDGRFYEGNKELGRFAEDLVVVRQKGNFYELTAGAGPSEMRMGKAIFPHEAEAQAIAERINRFLDRPSATPR